MNDFDNDSLEILKSAATLATQFNCEKVDEFHLIAKVWAVLEYPIMKSQIVDGKKFTELSEFWFDGIPIKTGEHPKTVRLSSSCLSILNEAKKISTELELNKITPVHILFGAIKADCKMKKKLRDYGFNPSSVISLPYVPSK